ncbi:unnamed protein product [Didymodactylos carnosus]|uniref:Uncharacterized protein n=1 Tax=Didymodactylos carnosus TaxID=1234261 RepID=A0A814PFZ1_9BILA|nr:unnamed protein product [Didymodactylos carnosus]CAF3870456.1 unnamed protein product [Didymodactylos carnosus]
MNADDEQEDDDDDNNSLQLKAKKITSEENDDFVKAFDTLITESVAQRTTEVIKVPAPDIAIPVHLRKNKVSSTNINVSTVPTSSEMALRLKAREEIKTDKARLKILMLNMSTRMEQDVEQQELMLNVLNRTPAMININRERQPLYVHQKGAPDADLIFGPKSSYFRSAAFIAYIVQPVHH